MQARWIEFLLNYGAAANLIVKTGIACPCMSFRSSTFPKYDPEYHRQFPLAENCNGTGLISVSTATTAIKAFFHDPLIQGYQNWAINQSFNRQNDLGEFMQYDQILNGTCNSSGLFVDLSGYVDDPRSVYITYASANYKIKRVLDLKLTGAIAAQVAGLMRYA